MQLWKKLRAISSKNFKKLLNLLDGIKSGIRKDVVNVFRSNGQRQISSSQISDCHLRTVRGIWAPDVANFYAPD